MDKNNKKEQEEKDKKQEESSDEKKLKELEEEISKLLDDMKVVLGDNEVPDVKVMSSNKVSGKKLILFQLIEVIVSIAILVGLTGYISWFRCDELYSYFIVIGGMTIIEFVLSYIINKFFLKAIFFSFGAILLVPTVAVFILAGFIIPLFGTIDISRLIIVGILYMISKRIIMRFIKGDNASFKIKTIKK